MIFELKRLNRTYCNLLGKISEPHLGSPLLVGYRGNLISQDLCNSVHEFYSVTDHIDIPPALYISQEYLKKVMPKEKVFSFRHFDSFDQIEKEFKQARIKFLLPAQIEYLPKDSFDIMLNVSSFHEMSKDQIKNYLVQINRLAKGYFYSKQWKKSKAPDNKFIREEQYPIPKGWKKIYKRTHPIQRLFFEALYTTRRKG